MQIEQRDGGRKVAFVRDGLVMISRQHATKGEKIFLPPPDWQPQDGHEKLVPVTVEEVYEGVALCKDADDAAWALWLA